MASKATVMGVFVLSARSAALRFFRYAIARWADHAIRVAFHEISFLIQQHINVVMLSLAKHQVVHPNNSIVLTMLAA